MLTGAHPFFAENVFLIHQRVVSRPPDLHPTLTAEAKSIISGGRRAAPSAMCAPNKRMCAGLLAKDPDQRLGRAPGDVEAHPFFEGLGWPALAAREVALPFKPVVLVRARPPARSPARSP
jgi:hypothetical protein